MEGGFPPSNVFNDSSPIYTHIFFSNVGRPTSSNGPHLERYDVRAAKFRPTEKGGSTIWAGREFFFPKRHSSSSAHYVSYLYSRMRDSSLVNLM